jgi:putative flippase GtrA
VNVRGTLLDFTRYVVGGGLATLLHLAVLATLVETHMVTPVVATSVGFCIGTAFNYTFQYYFTFRATGSHAGTFARYIAVTAVMFAVNVVLFRALTERLGLRYLFAQILATSVIMLCNFAANRVYTFKRA